MKKTVVRIVVRIVLFTLLALGTNSAPALADGNPVPYCPPGQACVVR